MTGEQYTAIINPICRQCTKLSFECIGLTVKDWVKAKNCNNWEFGYPDYYIFNDLNLIDYLIGSDLSESNKKILDNI